MELKAAEPNRGKVNRLCGGRETAQSGKRRRLEKQYGRENGAVGKRRKTLLYRI